MEKKEKKEEIKEEEPEGKKEFSSGFPELILRVRDMTRIDSYPVRNPNREIVEDRRQKTNYSIKDISVVMTRSKLVILMFEVLKKIDAPIWHFDYPRVSIAWYIALQLINYFFDPEFLLTYICLLLMTIMVVYS